MTYSRKKSKSLLFAILCLSPAIIFSQIINEKFDYEEFSDNLIWHGHIDSVTLYKPSSSTTYPLALKPSLRGNAKDADDNSFYLSTPNKFSFSTSNSEWSFWVKVPNATSGNNAKIYILSDRQNLLDQQLNGFYVSLG